MQGDSVMVHNAATLQHNVKGRIHTCKAHTLSRRSSGPNSQSAFGWKLWAWTSAIAQKSAVVASRVAYCTLLEYFLPWSSAPAPLFQLDLGLQIPLRVYER